jgi:hemolysin D
VVGFVWEQALHAPVFGRWCQGLQRTVQPRIDALGRHVEIWRISWEEAQRETPGARRQGREFDFLPAVLEIQESPPSPHGRAVAFTIIAVFGTAILWATFGHIDIIAVAQGKIIPSDRSKVIQPLEAGVVKAIHVRDGRAVRAGDLLIELDSTVATADEARFSNEHQAGLVEVARLKALLEGRATFAAPPGTDPNLVEVQRKQAVDQLAEHQARVNAARLAIEQRQAAIEATRANIERLQTTVPMLAQKAESYRKLREKGYVSELQYLEAEETRVNKTQELAVERQKLVQDTAALREAEHNHQVIVSEFKKARLAELAAAETKTASLSSEVIKAEVRTGMQRLTAPIDGVVQQLAVHTVGGVVTPAQQLMVIAPHEGQLEVEAWVENKDVGFVNADQDAEIKVEAFPFTRYGTIEGRILSLSKDAVPLEKTGLLYSARVSMAQSSIRVENQKNVPLSPGMTVSVEIKTGKRRLIEYFLSPLIQAGRESVRER